MLIALVVSSCTSSKKATLNNTERDTANALANEKKATKVSADSTESDPEPSFNEVLSDLRVSYNKVETIDKQIIGGKDTLELHESYYCLHDSSLHVPGHYMWGGADTTKDFIANTFAIKIIVRKNSDTILNREIKKEEFNKILWDRLQQYVIIMAPGYIGYNKSTGQFAIGCSLTIPLTDVGVPTSITVDKTGQYQILDEYSNLNGFEK